MRQSDVPHDPRRRAALWAGLAGGLAAAPAFAASPEAPQAQRSLDEFGAVGDGTTDDTSAVQAALDWAGNHAGTRLCVPPRVFAIARPLVVPHGIALCGTLAGDGQSPLSGFRALAGFASPYTLKHNDGTATSDVPVAALLISRSWVEGASFGRRLRIADLYLEVGGVQAGAGVPVHGIVLANQQAELCDVFIAGASGFGVWINTQKPDGSFMSPIVDTVLRRVWIRGAGVGGARFKTSYGKFSYGGILAGALPGARDSAGDTEPAVATDGVIEGCTVAVGPEADLGCRGNGIHVTRAAGWRVSGCHLNGIGRHGVVLERAYQTELSGCYVDGWGSDAFVKEGPFGAVWCNSILGLDNDAGGGVIISNNRISFRSAPEKASGFVAIALRAGATPGARVIVSANNIIRRRAASGRFALFDIAAADSGTLDAQVSSNSASGADQLFFRPWPASVAAGFSGNSFQRAPVVPGQGWHPAGYCIENSAPATGKFKGWVTVDSGDPPAWRGYARIEEGA